jgi:hypothetical protein|tara:strand:+ start:545 stop:742 length:198 start_codon:yes stop_codon:yes gene_type:complete
VTIPNEKYPMVENLAFIKNNVTGMQAVAGAQMMCILQEYLWTSGVENFKDLPIEKICAIAEGRAT